jgi:hypothetical protein
VAGGAVSRKKSEIVQVRCEEALKARLEAYRAATGAPLSEIVRRAVVEYLDRRERDLKTPAADARTDQGGGA